jgi:hypothetical protein
MKTPKEQKQIAEAKDEQKPIEQKNSACCGPTCCSSVDEKESKREEK